MAQLVPENHPTLHTIAESVTEDELAHGTVTKIIADMRAVLHRYNVDGLTAVAIAAPQIGVSKRIFLVEDQSKDRDPLPSFVAINPQIIKTSKRTKLVDEGCLSIPDKYGRVERFTHATLRAQDETGHVFERGTSGLLAQIIQHECDHLDGILFTDRAAEVWTLEESRNRA